MPSAFDISNEDIAPKYDELCKKLIGKRLRNHNMIVVATIIEVIIERDEYFNKTYFYAVLDNGTRINTMKLKGMQ